MFIYKKKILFGDCDPGGILFYANIFKYFHEAYERFIESFEKYENHFYNKEIAFPLVRAEADYHSPLFAGKEIDVRISVLEIKAHSFSIIYEVYEGDKKSVTGKTVHVCTDYSGKKQPLNENLRWNLEKFKENK